MIAKPAPSTSSHCRTSTVYVDGELVSDVTEHKAFRNAVQSGAGALRFSGPSGKSRNWMTFRPHGSNRRINRGWQMPRNYEEW